MAQATKSRKKYHVLGNVSDSDEGEQNGDGLEHQEAEPLPTIHDIENPLEHYPEDVWEAAVNSPDDGRAVLYAFNELHTTRALCSQRLATVRDSRALFTPKASTRASQLPPLASAKYASTNISTLKPHSLKPSTITSKIASSADARKLARYEQFANAWADAVADLADRTQRSEADLAMQRGPEFRSKLELTEAISRALPIEDRGDSSSVWAMSLRNAWERIVPLGNLLSGLCCVVHDFPSDGLLLPQQRRALQEKLTKIGRPLDLPPSTTGLEKALASTNGSIKPTLGRSLTARARDWSRSQVLQERMKQHAEAIARNGGYQPDMAGLKLEGQSVVDLALEATRMPVTLEEVQAHLMETDPQGYKTLREAWDQAARRKAAAAAAAAAKEQAEREAAEAEEAAAAKRAKPGPHARVSTTSLSLCTAARGRDRARFELVHEGTAALYYYWQRIPSQPHPFAPRSRTQQGPSPFLLARASGVLLPNETHTVEVDFMPQHAGMFHEEWQLMTTPQLLPSQPPSTTTTTSPQLPAPPAASHYLQGHFPVQGDVHDSLPSPGLNNQGPPESIGHTAPQIDFKQEHGLLQQQGVTGFSGVGGPPGGRHLSGGGNQGSTMAGGALSASTCQAVVTISVRGVATVEDQQVLERKALSRQLNEAEKESKVRQALEHILRCVDALPPPPLPEPPTEAAQALAWDSAQSDYWPPMYYPGPEVYAQLESAYREARGEVYRLRAEAAEAAEAAGGKGKKGAKGGKGSKDKEAPQTPEPPAREFPEQWSSGLADLYGVLEELEGMHQSTKAQLAEAHESSAGGSSKAAAAAAAEASAAAVQAADNGIARTTELRGLAQRLQLSTQAFAVPQDARTLIRHAMRAALGRVADAVESKLDGVHADYEKRVAEQQREGATVVPGKEVGPQWLADKCRAGAKAQARNLVPWLFEEVAREKGAVGDWLEARIADLDARIAAVEAGAPDPGPGQEVDAALEAAAAAAEAEREKAAAAAAAAAGAGAESAAGVPAAEVAMLENTVGIQEPFTEDNAEQGRVHSRQGPSSPKSRRPSAKRNVGASSEKQQVPTWTLNVMAHHQTANRCSG